MPLVNFAIVIKDFQIGTETKTSYSAPAMNSNGMMVGSGYSSSKSMDFTTEYMIWDFDESKAVSWGNIKASASANLFVSRGDWNNNFKSIAKQIIYKRPFKRAGR